MLDFFRLMLPLALFRRGPADIPYSSSLFVIALMAGAGVTVLAARMAGQSIGLSFVIYAVSVTVYVSSVALLLRLFDRQARLLQTLTAAVGASVVIGIAQCVLVLLASGGLSQQVVQAADLTIVLWAILIDGFILAAALELPMFVASMLALVILLMQFSVILALPLDISAGTG